MALISRQLNPNRSLALDVFRGLTIAGMILVNNPGSPERYATLKHAAWDGWTLTDLVFPFFAFIVGVALTYAIANRRPRTEWPGLSLFDRITIGLLVVKWGIRIATQTGGLTHAPNPALGGWDLFLAILVVVVIALPLLHRRAVRRGGSRALEIVHHGVLLFALGFVWDLNAGNFGSYRLFGVLQRLGVIYLAVGLIVLTCRRRGQLLIAAGLLAIYWLLMVLVPVPGHGAGVLTDAGNLASYLDWWLLNHAGMYTGGPLPYWDPEGFLSTIPAIVTGLLGALAGGWLREERPMRGNVLGLLLWGGVLAATGLWCDRWFPINKNLWSPPFVLLTGGIALVTLAACVWLVDMKGVRRSVAPFLVLGSNSILLYLLSETVRHYLGEIPAGTVNGVEVNLWQALYHVAFASWLAPLNASLALAICYVALWAAVAGVLYRRRIFVRI